MKRLQGLLLTAFVVIFMQAQSAIAAELVEGQVKEVDYTRKTFQLCKIETEGTCSEDTIFMVLPSTGMKGMEIFLELEPGNKVSVEAEAINPAVWKVLTLHKK